MGAWVLAALAMSAQAAAQLTIYEREGFEGRSLTAKSRVSDLRSMGFNDRASSAVVLGSQWEVCESAGFGGRCVVLRPGRYPSLGSMGLNDRVSSMRVMSRSAGMDDRRYAPAPAAAQVIFYENAGFQGRHFITQKQVANFRRFGFNDRASSVVVIGERWEVCENVQFKGRCVVLRPGRYSSLSAMGLNDRVSSVRAVGRGANIADNRYAPPPAPVYDSRRRNNERLYEANVTSVRAVLGTPEQRCWVEREEIVQDQRNTSLSEAIAGILGYQLADAQPEYQNVQRCATVPSRGRPDHWDVTYNFRGRDHRIQTTAPPGPTVTVNAQGEPRV
ncbi:MAG TPA: beta/gamma crystallin family protein [Burkholderiales bacterium]|nr:beta/gamma crystallin family protein [Burkholderiales bacterium]